MEITAWHDERKRAEALESVTEIYYYMVHATNVNERLFWAVEYTKRLGGVKDGC